MRFVFVNGRTPSPTCVCVMCGEPVTARYLREIGTRLCYCDHDCYTDHCKSAVLALTARAS